MITEVNKLLNSYYSWLKENTVLKQIDEYVEITTPYLDRHNDFLQIYVKKEGSNFLLSDGGYIISDLMSSGCSFDSPKRKELLKITLNGFAVNNDGNTLFTMSDSKSFSLKKHNLIQAMLAVNDLFYTSRPYIASLFIEDVAKWLDSNNIRFIQNLKFTGKTGFDFSFHFAIPKSSKQPERILQAISYPSKVSVENFILSWIDTREARPKDSKAFALLNDQELEIKPNIYEALVNYEIKATTWSERKTIVDELVT